jgi:hypothetical protein
MHSAFVVVAEVLRQCATQRGLCQERDAARQLGLEGVKEGFGASVVTRSANARALCHAVTRDEGAEGRAHVLRAPIAVEDQAAWWATALKRRVEDGAGLARGATSTERPREHASTRRE